MRWLKITGIILGFFVLGVLALGLILRPPTLEIPEVREFSLYNVTLVQPGEFTRSGQDVLVRAGRIHSIRPTGSRPGQEVDPALQHTGGYLFPGLIDLHVHHPPRLAVGQQELWSLLYIAHGVTGVRDIGDIDGSVGALKEKIGAGAFVGPAITRCGMILDGDPSSFPSNLRLNTPEAARSEVLQLKEQGVDCVKVYTMLRRDVLREIQRTAAEVELPVLGHLPHSVSLEESNLKEIQHFMGIPIVDTEQAGFNESSLSDWVALTDERIDRQIEVSRRQGIEHLPTLFNIARREWQLDDSGWATDTALRHMPRFWAGAWRTLWGKPYKNEFEQAQRATMTRRMNEILRRMHARGVTVHLGTDTLMPFVAPGSSLHGEMRAFIDAGVPVVAVLKAATAHAGTHMNPPSGRIEPGYPADLLLLDENPLANPEVLREPRLVVAGGRMYSRGDLDRKLARYDAHFLQGIYPALMDVLVLGIQELFRR